MTRKARIQHCGDAHTDTSALIPTSSDIVYPYHVTIHHDSPKNRHSTTLTLHEDGTITVCGVLPHWAKIRIDENDIQAFVNHLQFAPQPTDV